MTNPELAASFEYAKRLRDPAFRRILNAQGCGHDQDVVVAIDSTRVVDVLNRVFTRCRPPALVAVQRPAAAHGFVFLMVRPATSRPDEDDQERRPMSEDIEIGMLYDAVKGLSGMAFHQGPGRTYTFQPVPPELVDAGAGPRAPVNV